MDLKNRIEAFDQDSRVLEEIANRFPAESKEYHALRRAAIALWYVLREKYAEFKDYVENFDRDLSPSEKRHLRELRIHPDVDPDAPGV
jgi:hypothetical protein